MIRQAGFWGTLFVLSLSCAHRPPLGELEKISAQYGESFRWRNYSSAASYWEPSQRTGFLEQYEEKNELEVEDYEILGIDLVHDFAAKVRVRMAYVLRPSVVQQRKNFVQEWFYRDGRWILEHQSPSM